MKMQNKNTKQHAQILLSQIPQRKKNVMHGIRDENKLWRSINDSKKNISDGLPHLEKEFIGEYCRSRYPLPKPSKRCKDHMRDGE
jgi:hypothetical protein